MTGKGRLKVLAAAFVAYCVVKELVSPSPWNVHDPDWQYPQIYTGTVPPQLEEIRGRVAPGAVPRYDGRQPTNAEAAR